MRSDELKKHYHLEAHPEGGWFAEVYTAPSSDGARPPAGSIYFLLDAGELSHFHQIDCDEIWYFHEGCGLKITALLDGKKEEYLLGHDVAAGQNAMVLIRKGSVFAAENLAPGAFSFVSCATAPKFRYDGFRLVYREEIRESYPEIAEEIAYLAYPQDGSQRDRQL